MKVAGAQAIEPSSADSQDALAGSKRTGTQTGILVWDVGILYCSVAGYSSTTAKSLILNTLSKTEITYKTLIQIGICPCKV